MVVEKDSSILGYPGEISKGLDADHHTVVKFDSRQDDKYLAVRNYLQTQLDRLFRSRGSRASTQSTAGSDIVQLEELFALSEAIDMDYVFFRDRWTPGTCEWILKETEFLEWRDDPDPASRLLWLYGVAGSGKSVMASFIINHLINEVGKRCQFVFLRFGDLNKKSVGKMLRSLALQCAQVFPEFRHALKKISARINLSGSDPRTIWERVFKSVLFKLQFVEPLYWVVDGLEECESPRTAVRLLSEALATPVPIRIALTSRHTSGIEAELKRLPQTSRYAHMMLQGRTVDHEIFITENLELTDTDGELTRRLISSAQGNFLWIKLTVDRINKSYMDAAVEEALRELPPGMEELYDRMAESVQARSSSSYLQKALSTDILSWATSSLRPLSISELSEGLDAGSDRTLNLNMQKAITDLCAGFVIIDNDERVSLIHQTAREYLMTPKEGLCISKAAANQIIFLRCLVCLNIPGLRSKIDKGRPPLLLNYAASYWTSHLVSSDSDAEVVIESLLKFLRSPSVLTWIHAVAYQKELHVLLQSSTHLTKFSAKKRQQHANQSNQLQPEDLALIEDWATDLGKLVGKFGSQLLHTPDSIYKMIPPFCPTRSVLHRQFVRRNSSEVAVSGFSDDWDDSLARLSFSADFEASELAAEGELIAVSAESTFPNDSASTIFLYSMHTYQELRAINHGERVRKMSLNSLGTRMVTIGLRTTKVWDLQSGDCTNIAQNPRGRPRPQAIFLSQQEQTLMVGTDDRRIWSLSLTEYETTFEEILRVTETLATGGFANSSSSMAFSPDGRHLAIGYRQRPMSLWDVESRELIQCCSELNRATHLVWHPYNGAIFGLTPQAGSRVFRWSANNDDELISFHVEATTITISADGHILALGDQYGNVCLLSTADLSVLYKVVAEDPVKGLAFSVGRNQLFDIRSSYGNVWEPNILLKLSGPNLHLSDGDSESDSDSRLMPYISCEIPAGALSPKIDPITALGSPAAGELYCSGTRRGVVALHHTSLGVLKLLSNSENFNSIQKIAWSHDQRYICYADVTRKIFVEFVTYDPNSKSASTERVLELPLKELKGNIEIILFHEDSELILVCSGMMAAVVSIDRQTILSTYEVGNAQSHGKWVNQPGKKGNVLHVTPRSIDVFSWLPLARLASVPLDASNDSYLEVHSRALSSTNAHIHAHDGHKHPESLHMTVEDIILSPSRHRALIRYSNEDHHNFIRWLDLRGLEELGDRTGGISAASVSDIPLPQELTGRLDKPLGFLSETRNSTDGETLLFLDCHSWVYSAPVSMSHTYASSSRNTTQVDMDTIADLGDLRLPMEQSDVLERRGSTQSQLTPHYCLPGDWVSPDCISLLLSMSDGTLLCPRNGKVAVVNFIRPK